MRDEFEKMVESMTKIKVVVFHENEWLKKTTMYLRCRWRN